MPVPTSASTRMLFVKARRARRLKKVQRIGRQRPYLKLWAGRTGTKVKTSFQQDDGSGPVWGEWFMFDIQLISSEEYLCFEVKNKNIADSASIGMGKVPLMTFGATIMETWYTIYDEMGREAGEVLLEAGLDGTQNTDREMGETGRNLQRLSNHGTPLPGRSITLVAPDLGAYRSHAAPHPSGQNPWASASGHAPSPSMPAGFPNIRRGAYSTASAPSAVSSHGEHRSAQAGSNASAVYDGDTSTHSTVRSQHSSGGGVGTADGWASARSSRVDADDRRWSYNGAGDSLSSTVVPYGANTSMYGTSTMGPSAPSAAPALQSDDRGRGSMNPHAPRSLVPRWEQRVTNEGRTFYVDHTASGHLSREGSFSSRHGRPGRALSSPDTWVAHHGDNTRYANGFSSSCHDDQHSNYRHSPQPSLMQNGGSGVKSGGGGGGGGSSTSRNISLHQQSPQHLHMGDRGTHDQTHDLRDEVGGPSRSGMTVQDLKHMTAMRMGHPSIGSRGGGGGGAGRGGSGGSGSVGGSVGGAIGEGKRSVLSSTSGSPPPDLLPSSSRHRTGLLHLSSTGRDTSPRPTATTQHILRASASARESRQERQQQHDLPPPPGVVLSRHSSAHAAVGGSPRYSHHHQQPNGSRGQLTARGSDMVSGHQIPQRGIHRGMSAPRLYPAAQDDQMPSGAHGGGASGGPRPFGPGLSVEELKEMTKLRLQQQGRSSPTFAGRAPSSGGLGSSLGSNGGVVHERTEWRRSGSAGSAAMMEEHGTAGAAPAPFRRANSLAARGMMQGEHSSAAMNGRRMFGSSGRMEIALPLEDRMRTLTSDGGTGGVSPRILSQPSSPCYSATSHSSSACTSPGGGRVHREGRGGGGGGGVGRYGGGGGGSAYAHSAHVPPPGFGDSGAPAAADGVYPTVTLPLSGDGGEKGFWSRHDSGNALHGFPNGDGSLHDVRGGRHHNRSGSGSTGASPRMESIDVNGAQPLGRRSSHMHHSFEDDGSVGGRGRNGLAGAGSFQAPAAARSLPMQTISRPMSLSLSPPGMVGSHINDNLSDPGNSNGSVSGGRKSSNPHWLDLQDAHVGGGSSSGLDLGGHRGTHFARSISRPTDLRLNNVNFEYPARPQSAGSVIGEGSSKIMSSVAAASWVRAGAPASSSAPSSTEDATAMMCAEFALLTPKSALQQHNQQQQHRVVGSPMPTWPPSWDATHDACDTIAESARRSEIADSGGVPSALRGRDAFNGSVGSVRGVASQGSRGGSEVGSPEGPQASKGGEEVDEQSTGSGGGSQQGSVHAAFGALDAAAGHGSGGGGEANVGGGGFDGSFADNADGDAGRNGGAEAQRYEGPLMHPTSFFGEDLPDCEGMGLEDESPASDDRSGSASGADSVGSPGSGAGAGKVASAGPADGTALAVAMDNQLSF